MKTAESADAFLACARDLQLGELDKLWVTVVSVGFSLFVLKTFAAHRHG